MITKTYILPFSVVMDMSRISIVTRSHDDRPKRHGKDTGTYVPSIPNSWPGRIGHPHEVWANKLDPANTES